MKILLSVILLLLSKSFAENTVSSNNLLNTLKKEITDKRNYDELKENRIRKLKLQLSAIEENDLTAQYIVYDKLYNEYKDFVFDSAHVYTRKLISVSGKMNDLPKYYGSKIKLGTIQLSWGMFKETFDGLDKINVSNLPDSVKLRYYELKSQAYTNLALYNTDKYYSPVNKGKSSTALDSALQFTRSNSYERFKHSATLYQLSGENLKAVQCYQQIVYNTKFSYHQRAMAAHDLSFLSPQFERIKLITLAAIYDIRSSTKETLAICTLGKILIEQGNLQDAEIILKEAFNQASFYGNKLHAMEISATLTSVSGQKLINSESKKNQLLIRLIILLMLAITATAFLYFLVYQRLKKVKEREISVTERNLHLDKINKKLSEDASIKEEYIGYFFNIISGYILKLEKIKRHTERGIKMKNDKELSLMANEINIKKERKALFYTFDNIFLKLFPNFIRSFNAMLKPEDQIWPKCNEVLNTNLRIFALMRLGIKDNQTIANILENTVSTIYTYKLRIKSKALLTGEDFEKKVMEISFVDANNADASINN